MQAQSDTDTAAGGLRFRLGLAIFVFYLDPSGLHAVIAFAIGLIAETAALTLLLRRRDFRELSREYSGETIDLPSTLHG